MRVKRIHLYEDRPNVTLTCYIQEDSPEMLNGKKRPAVLVAPGGAYAFCSDREADPIALKFASMGYHSFILRYSVFSNSGTMFGIPGRDPVYEPSVQPGPMREIGRAMLTIREHAEDWLVDMENVFLTGYSAGAHNCAMFSVYWDQPVICDALGCRPEEIRPAAAVLGYGFFDVPAFHRSLERIGDEQRIHLNELINYNYGGKTHLSEEEMDFLSPAYHLSENTPPMFLWSTYEDKTVPVSQSTLMATALAEHDIPFELHIFEKCDHGLSTADLASASAMPQVDADVAQWVGLADRWLKKHVMLELPAELQPWERPE